MASANQGSKDHVNFRLDPALKSAFTEAAEADRKPAAEVLRGFMRAYVAQKRRSAVRWKLKFSRLPSRRARDPKSNEYAAMRELDAEPDRDAFAAEWRE